MSLHLYAVCAERPRGLGRQRGVAGEPLRAVRAGRLVAVIGDIPGPPPLEAATLRAHDATVRALAKSVDALLPVRFGTVAVDDAQVAAMVAERGDMLAEALDLVAGREQMTLRVFARAALQAGRRGDIWTPANGSRSGLSGPRTGRSGPRTGRSGAGAQYLAARRAADRAARAVPEIAWLRPALRPLVKAERVERHRTPPLVATVHHLIVRGEAAAYLTAIEHAPKKDRPVRVVPSGPWPPWAFTGEP